MPQAQQQSPARRHSQSQFFKKGAKVKNYQSLTNKGMLKFLNTSWMKKVKLHKIVKLLPPWSTFWLFVDIPLNLFPDWFLPKFYWYPHSHLPLIQLILSFSLTSVLLKQNSTFIFMQHTESPHSSHKFLLF